MFPCTTGPSPSASQQHGTDSIILEEEIDPNYVPTENEVLEYAKWLGMDLQEDQVRLALNECIIQHHTQVLQ
jgi:hypothetical protein